MMMTSDNKIKDIIDNNNIDANNNNIDAYNNGNNNKNHNKIKTMFIITLI